MKTIVLPVSACSRITSSCMSRRISGSSALNGSSKSSTCGSSAKARASPTRCCMPPESWSGYWFSKPVSPTSSTICWARAVRSGLEIALDLEAERDVLDHPAVREQPEVLEDHGDRAAPERPQLVVVGGGDVPPGDAHRPGGRLDQAHERADERRLARARQPHDDEDLAGPDLEADVAHGGDAPGLLAQLGPREVGRGRPDDAVGVRPEHLPDAVDRDQRITGAVDAPGRAGHDRIVLRRARDLVHHPTPHTRVRRVALAMTRCSGNLHNATHYGAPGIPVKRSYPRATR